jgi:hypothetical protein
VEHRISLQIAFVTESGGVAPLGEHLDEPTLLRYTDIVAFSGSDMICASVGMTETAIFVTATGGGLTM